MLDKNLNQLLCVPKPSREIHKTEVISIELRITPVFTQDLWCHFSNLRLISCQRDWGELCIQTSVLTSGGMNISFAFQWICGIRGKTCGWISIWCLTVFLTVILYILFLYRWNMRTCLLHWQQGNYKLWVNCFMCRMEPSGELRPQSLKATPANR